MNFTNNYIPEFVPDNLKWYERDSLMTYIDRLKYDNFIKDTDRHFEKRRSLILISYTNRLGERKLRWTY